MHGACLSKQASARSHLYEPSLIIGFAADREEPNLPSIEVTPTYAEAISVAEREGFEPSRGLSPP